MQPNEYQKLAMRTKGEYKDTDDQLICATLGLTGEAGEFADYIKKHKYQGHIFNSLEATKELGDICWYLALACDAVGVDLDIVMAQNIEKLRQRYPGKGFEVEKSVNRKEVDG